MKYILAAFFSLLFTEAFAQSLPTGQVSIDLPKVMSGVSERSLVSWKCTQLANAAVYAYVNGQLSSAMNEAAKTKKLGSSDSQFFNNLIKLFHLDPKDDLLFSALFLSQLDIAWLEEQAPYKSELKPIYTAYLAASCARVAKIDPNN